MWSTWDEYSNEVLQYVRNVDWMKGAREWNVEWVKHNTLRWYGYVRGRWPALWKGRVEQYTYRKVERVRRSERLKEWKVCVVIWASWRNFYSSYFLTGIFHEEKGIRAIIRNKLFQFISIHVTVIPKSGCPVCSSLGLPGSHSLLTIAFLKLYNQQHLTIWS